MLSPVECSPAFLAGEDEIIDWETAKKKVSEDLQ